MNGSKLEGGHLIWSGEVFRWIAKVESAVDEKLALLKSGQASGQGTMARPPNHK